MTATHVLPEGLLGLWALPAGQEDLPTRSWMTRPPRAWPAGSRVTQAGHLRTGLRTKGMARKLVTPTPPNAPTRSSRTPQSASLQLWPHWLRPARKQLRPCLSKGRRVPPGSKPAAGCPPSRGVQSCTSPTALRARQPLLLHRRSHRPCAQHRPPPSPGCTVGPGPVGRGSSCSPLV